jgi:hypothetical protein
MAESERCDLTPALAADSSGVVRYAPSVVILDITTL